MHRFCNTSTLMRMMFVTMALNLQRTSAFFLRKSTASANSSCTSQLPTSMVVSSFDLSSSTAEGDRQKRTRLQEQDEQFHLPQVHKRQLHSSSAQREAVLDPLIVCGPSGVGKGTIINRFMTSNSDLFGFTVSHTTRKPREGEVDGIHYHFVEHAVMETLLQENFFLESAQVHGNYYGTSWQSMKDVQLSGRRYLLDIDVQGVQKLKALQTTPEQHDSVFPLDPKFIFIAPPSIEALEARLIGRGSESEESMKRRLANARAEVEYGHAGHFDAVIVNDDLDQAVLDFEAAVRKLYKIE